MELHPLALMLPEMSEDEFAELRADIAAQGLMRPVVLYEGKVLDGRHRLRACNELGVPPRFEEFDGDTPAAYVLSANVRRRHLTASQRAALAVAFLPELEAEAKKRQGARTDLTSGPDRPTSEQPKHRARDDAGALVGVSGTSVDRARRVQREDPEMFEEVKAGVVSVYEADDVIRARNGSERKPTRDGSYKRRSVDLFSNVVDRLAVMPMALREIDTTAAILDPDAPLEDWDRKLTDSIQTFNRLRGQIRKEMSK